MTSDKTLQRQYPFPIVSCNMLNSLKMRTGMDIEDMLPIFIQAAYNAVFGKKVANIRPINVDELTEAFRETLPPEMFKVVQETLSSFIPI